MAETEYEVSLGGQTVTFRGDAALSDQDVLRQAAIQLSRDIPTNAQGQVESGPMAESFRAADPRTTVAGALSAVHEGPLGQGITAAGRMLNFDTPTGAAMTGLGLPLIAKAGGMANAAIQGAAKIPHMWGLGGLANLGLRYGAAPAAEIGTDAALAGGANYVLGESPGAGATAGGTMGALLAIARRSPTTAKAIFGALFGAGGAELGGGDPIKGALLGAGAGVLVGRMGGSPSGPLPVKPGTEIPPWLNTAEPGLLKAEIAAQQARASQLEAARKSLIDLGLKQSAALEENAARGRAAGVQQSTAMEENAARTRASGVQQATAIGENVALTREAGVRQAGALEENVARKQAANEAKAAVQKTRMEYAQRFADQRAKAEAEVLKLAQEQQATEATAAALAQKRLVDLGQKQSAAIEENIARTRTAGVQQAAALGENEALTREAGVRQAAALEENVARKQAGLPDAGPMSQQAGREMAIEAGARGATRDVGRLASEVFGVPNLHQNPMALYETVTLKGPKIAHDAFAQGLADIEATVPTLSWGRGENAVIEMGTGEAMEKVANLGRRAFAGKPNPVAQREYKELTAGIESALPEEERNFFIQLKRDYARRRGLTALLDMNPLDPATLHVDPEAIRATLVKGPSARRLVQREGEDAFKELLQAFGIGRGSVAEVGSRLPLSHAP